MNYAEMTDFEINKAVLSVLSKFPVHPTPRGGGSAAGAPVSKNSILHWFDFCNSWADAGPIIADNTISLIHGHGFWDAMTDDGSVVSTDESNPLRAAMIVFLMMQEKPDAA
ncbi:phage protein NinX family protein [Pantoea sp. GM_Pan_4]|uniref:phage protein NinX family protein n=1 Tax=Pantoea sp. GM_Pan_4 TaxID=2937389 RepID=UPI002269F07F|nr:phage protein NinX family protein [Pantoea sp. GM_Pan_4]